MRRLGKKIVCASARGYLTATEGPDLPTRIAFDPGLGAFVQRGTRRQIIGAQVARFDEHGCTAVYGESLPMGRPALARCDQHTDAPAYTASRCPACRTLRGTAPPVPRKPGTTGAQRRRRAMGGEQVEKDGEGG